MPNKKYNFIQLSLYMYVSIVHYFGNNTFQHFKNSKLDSTVVKAKKWHQLGISKREAQW